MMEGNVETAEHRKIFTSLDITRECIWCAHFFFLSVNKYSLRSYYCKALC